MKYVKITTPTIVIDQVVETLSFHLRSGERVAWLLSGGSAIELEVRIAQALQAHDISRLSVSLIDERYGPAGHKDENYQQLMDAHFPFYVTRVLSNYSVQKTTEIFSKHIDTVLDSADYSLGIFGVGTDGHTAGLKPHSPGLTSTETAVSYEWDDYTRVTITPDTIRRLDEAVTYAVGKEKAATLHSLLHDKKDLNTQPAQILREVKTSTLYTDNPLIAR